MEGRKKLLTHQEAEINPNPMECEQPCLGSAMHNPRITIFINANKRKLLMQSEVCNR